MQWVESMVGDLPGVPGQMPGASLVCDKCHQGALQIVWLLGDPCVIARCLTCQATWTCHGWSHTPQALLWGLPTDDPLEDPAPDHTTGGKPS